MTMLESPEILESPALPKPLLGTLEEWLEMRNAEVCGSLGEPDIDAVIRANISISALVSQRRRKQYDHNIATWNLRTVQQYCGHAVANDLVVRYGLAEKFGIHPYAPPPSRPLQGKNVCGQERAFRQDFRNASGHAPCTLSLKINGHEKSATLFRVIRLKRDVSLHPSVWTELDTLYKGESLSDAWDLICVITGLDAERDFPMSHSTSFAKVSVDS